ncbi:SafA/ExsA family spore coat assembly protein [Niallia sp. 01092]|uniref:SafA/ExsA family spore coat assembly protein n=1 Tax=unclassified Niallia TaxID=2837522 RepID=UPI003FD36D91
MKIHIVQKGDTLWEIAKKYGVNFEELKMLNSQLSNPDMIMPGMKIKVPTTGGSIKKEAPITGTKKEMPKAEHPFVKEKPKTMPIKEEIPKKEMPIKEVPKKEMPIKEVPKEKPFTPKMPTPIIPEIDINNYYSMNMTNVDVDVVDIDIEKTIPQPPPKPIVKKEAPIKQEVCPPIIPYQPICVSPMMPGSGFPPGVCPPDPCAAEQMPTHYETLPGVEHTHYQHWKDESSSSSHMQYHTHHKGVEGYAMPTYHETGNIPKEYYQQPLVAYGQMPAEHGHVLPKQYKQESSSDFMGKMHMQPTQMPYSSPPAADDCGCGGPSMPQLGYASPEAGFSPQMGAYPYPESFGGGMPQMQPGVSPQMGGYPQPESFGGGIPQMQPGVSPQMGGYPQPESFGGGMPQMQPGFSPQMGGYPQPESFGGGMPQMQPGFSPQMGGYPQPESFGGGMPQMQPGFSPRMGGYPYPESFGGGIPQMQPGFRPDMLAAPPFPGVYNPMGPHAPMMLQNPYPPGSVGNTPTSEYAINDDIQNGHLQPDSFGNINQQEMAPPVFGPGGTAPVYMPPYHGNFAQPPLINPYGVDARTPFGMPQYHDDESSDYGN